MNMKSLQQMQFESSLAALTQEFQILQNPNSSAKLDEVKISDLRGKIKSLRSQFNKADDALKKNIRNPKYNEFDIKNKQRKYEDSVKNVEDKLVRLQKRVLDNQRNDLMKDRNQIIGDVSNIDRQLNHVERLRNVNRDAHQTLTITNNTNIELQRHDNVIKDINNDASEMEHELSMSEQIMKAIGNRELTNKVILVLLVFFVGFADILILLVKVLGK